MKPKSLCLAALAAAVVLFPRVAPAGPPAAARPAVSVPALVDGEDTVRVVRTDAQWKKLLPPEAYHILREHGTEIAFTGRYWNNHARGVYRCAACNNLLFRSADKFDSGTGWPSFTRPAFKYSLELTSETSVDGEGSELQCRRCGGHLGHVFDDGPAPTGRRYCIDGNALKFVPESKAK